MKDEHEKACNDRKRELQKTEQKVSQLKQEANQKMEEVQRKGKELQAAQQRLDSQMESFNKKKPSLEGIASGELIQANTTGDWGKGSTISICKPKSAAPSKMFVSVRPGTVSATFTAAKAAPVKAMLMNAMGQVIAQQNFTAGKGTNSVELSNSYRGHAMLVIKAGSQQLVQKLMLK